MSKSLIKITDYLLDNPGRTALEISKDLNMSRNTIDELLRNNKGLLRREKVFSGRLGYRNAKIMNHIYFATDAEPLLERKVIHKKYEPAKITPHPIMRAMYGI